VFAIIGLVAFSSLDKLNDLMAAASPIISYIERWSVSGTNGVLIHFDTEANKTYRLQSTDKLGTNAVWTDLFKADPFPGPNHYVVPDLRPGNHYYRLSVTR
jgi:hypothetical protein